MDKLNSSNCPWGNTDRESNPKLMVTTVPPDNKIQECIKWTELKGRWCHNMNQQCTVREKKRHSGSSFSRGMNYFAEKLNFQGKNIQESICQERCLIQ
jgi:hypothetical protein